MKPTALKRIFFVAVVVLLWFLKELLLTLAPSASIYGKTGDRL